MSRYCLDMNGWHPVGAGVPATDNQFNPVASFKSAPSLMSQLPHTLRLSFFVKKTGFLLSLNNDDRLCFRF